MTIYDVRLYVHKSARSGFRRPGVCDTNYILRAADPFQFAVRALKLDAARPEPECYSRAEVWELVTDSVGTAWKYLREIRLSPKTRDRWKKVGQYQRGEREPRKAG